MRRAIAVGVGLACASAAVFLLVGDPQVPAFLKSNNAPGWVQAGGALAALVVAIAIPLIDGGVQRARFQAAAITISGQIVSRFKTLEALTKSNFEEVGEIWTDAAGPDLGLLTEAMERLPIERMGSADAITAFLRISGAARRGIGVYNSSRSGALAPEKAHLELSRLSQLVSKQDEQLRSALSGPGVGRHRKQDHLGA